MTQEQFIEAALRHYASLKELENSDNLYDLEKGFIGIWKQLGNEILEKVVSEVPANDRKKNFRNDLR